MAGGGSDPAFAMLYRRFDGPLHGYSLSIVKNPEDARDVLQSAWMKALVALRSGSRRAPVRPWLFRIVHNEAIDLIRRRRGEEPLLESHQRVGGAAGADEEVAEREQVAEVVADLHGLPEGQRAALVMREWADFEYEEIALALATSEGNARQLVFTARSGLAESRAGRNQSCDAIRLELAGADGRRLRNRRIRSHLDGCDACREFSAETRDRRRAAAAAVLPWAPVAAPELLTGLVGGGSAATGVAGGSALLGGLAKGAAVAAIVTGGVGGAELAVEKSLRPERAESAGVVEVERSTPDRAPALKASAAAGSPAAPEVKPAAREEAVPAVRLSVTKAVPPSREARLAEDESGGERARPGDDGQPRRGARDRRSAEGQGGYGGGGSDGGYRRDRRAPDTSDGPSSSGDSGGYRDGEAGYRDGAYRATDRSSHTDFLRGPSAPHGSG